MKNRLGSLSAVALLFAATLHAQQSPQSPQDRATLLKAEPNISGQRNGQFLEPAPLDFADRTGFTSLFDGKTLTGWDGMPGVWSVRDGAIVGESTREHVAGNTFLVYQNARPRDFDLKFEIKVEQGGGSGVQYRSTTGIPPGRTAGKGEPPLDPRWVMIGPQFDFWLSTNARNRDYSGQLYSQNTHRGILAWRGQVVQTGINADPDTHLVGAIGDRAALGQVVHEGDWNQVEVIARGPVILNFINGQLMSALIDDDPQSSDNIAGLIGLQIEGTPCRVSFRNLWLKNMDRR